MKKYIFLIITISFCLETLSDGRYIFDKNAQGLVYLMTDTGSASGVILSNKGYVLTNWHAIEGANISDSSIALHWGYDLGDYENHIFKFQVIKFDKTKDLALLKIIDPPNDLRVIKVSKVIPPIGSESHAIGHPNGAIWTYTKGYISQYRSDYEWIYEENGIVHSADVYQTQTPISEGNSGGPLLNTHGNLIGINTFGSEKYQALNYAIGVSEIVKFLSSSN
jgi:serine protease DegS|tara:strand:- start:216 stop:881 length:666 start_codon:yes stop_codon:yes gene_type:complete